MEPYFDDGQVVIYHGDCREVLPSLAGFDMVVTSPPYGEIRDYGGHGKPDLLAVIGLLAAGLRPGGVVMWNVADQTVDGSESGESFQQALHAKASGLRLHDTMVYCKEAVVFPDENRYHPAFEYMFVWSKGAPRHFNGIRDRKNRWAGDKIHGTRREKDGITRRPHKDGDPIPENGLRWNWWVLPTAAQETHEFDHPAKMPIAMARAHIETWSIPGETVLDPFAGSGTTLRAAKDLGRRAIGIEIEEKYCEIAAKRMAQSAMQFEVLPVVPQEQDSK